MTIHFYDSKGSRQMRILRDSFIRHDECGATAIEYGLMVGLVALGIMGALVTTKSSLNADYNCIATAVGSSGGTPCAAAAAQGSTPSQPAPFKVSYNALNPRASYWSQKTITSGPTLTKYSNSNTWVTNFSDGSSMSYTMDSSGNQFLDYLDPNTLIETQYVMDSAGRSNSGFLYFYSSYPFTSNNKTSYNYSYSFSGTNPTSMYSGPCNPSACSGPSGAASQQFITAMNNSYNDTAIWAANAPK